MINIAIDGKSAQLPLKKALQLVQQKAARYPEKAISLLFEILTQQPKELQIYHLMFALLNSVKRYRDLKTSAEQAIDYFPNDATSYYALSTALRYLREPKEQLRTLEKAIELAPTQIHWQKQLAICLKELGQFEHATATFDRCITKKVSICECLYWRYSINKTIAADELETLVLFANFLSSSTHLDSLDANHIAESIYAAFCLFDYFDKQDNYQKAWHYLSLANAAKRRALNNKSPYSIASELEEHEKIEQHFSRKMMNKKRLKPSEITTNKQDNIFICGLPRSGTTLTEQILSSHTDVAGGDELFALAQSSTEVLKMQNISEPFPLWSKSLEDNNWQQIGIRYQQNTHNLHLGQQWLTDKMPLNYKAIGIIHLALPKAKIIYCQRNPVDVLWGCYKQMLGSGNVFTYQLDELCDMIIAHDRLMQYWLSVIPEKIFVMRYRELLNDQETVTRSLLKFIGLPWQNACLDFHLNERIVHTISNVQIRKPLFHQTKSGWLPYEAYLKPYQQKLKAAGLID